MLVVVKDCKLVLNAAALRTFVVGIATGAEYSVEVIRGSVPSSV